MCAANHLGALPVVRCDAADQPGHQGELPPEAVVQHEHLAAIEMGLIACHR
jgi:hypothetical protein